MEKNHLHLSQLSRTRAARLFTRKLSDWKNLLMATHILVNPWLDNANISYMEMEEEQACLLQQFLDVCLTNWLVKFIFSITSSPHWRLQLRLETQSLSKTIAKWNCSYDLTLPLLCFAELQKSWMPGLVLKVFFSLS